MLKQKHGRIINMSPPISTDFANGKVAYSISKFGMTLIAHGLAEETRGTGVAINALWPATMIESFATINHKLGDRSLWRKAAILAECSLGLVLEGDDFSGHALIDEDYLAARGVHDLTAYRCDPNVEPPRLSKKEWKISNVGKLEDTKARL